MTRNFIYGLIDPRSLLVRYVGYSSRGMDRPREHRKPSRTAEPSYRSSWIKSLLAEDLVYDIVVLEEAQSREALLDLERWWVAYGRACGWPLTNLTDGGDGMFGHKMSAETRAKIGAAFRGRKCSPEHVAKVVASLKGRPVSSETRAKMSATAKASGRRPSRLAVEKAIAVNKSRGWSEEARAKHAQYKHSNETRAKMSASHKGRAKSPEHRASLRAAWVLRRQRTQDA
mgnify:CR=1 FL=1